MSSFSYPLHQISLLNSKPYAQMLTGYLYIKHRLSNISKPQLNFSFSFHPYSQASGERFFSFLHCILVFNPLISYLTGPNRYFHPSLFFSTYHHISRSDFYLSLELLQCLFVSHASSFLQFIFPLVKTFNHTMPMHKILQLFHIV